MKIQINTDKNITRTDELTDHIESTIEDALDRFTDRITRVEVRLTDQNSSKKDGDDDMRCVMEARLSGLQPIVVSHQTATIELAVDGAAEKLETAIERTLGRLDDTKGGMSASGTPTD